MELKQISVDELSTEDALLFEEVRGKVTEILHE